MPFKPFGAVLRGVCVSRTNTRFHKCALHRTAAKGNYAKFSEVLGIDNSCVKTKNLYQKTGGVNYKFEANLAKSLYACGKITATN